MQCFVTSNGEKWKRLIWTWCAKMRIDLFQAKYYSSTNNNKNSNESIDGGYRDKKIVHCSRVFDSSYLKIKWINCWTFSSCAWVHKYFCVKISSGNAKLNKFGYWFINWMGLSPVGKFLWFYFILIQIALDSIEWTKQR